LVWEKLETYRYLTYQLVSGLSALSESESASASVALAKKTNNEEDSDHTEDIEVDSSDLNNEETAADPGPGKAQEILILVDSISSHFNVLNTPISTTAPIDTKTHVV
jgi:hypothetical protein